MKLGVALKLGRVSNLPTVVSNVAAAVALAGESIDPAPAVLLSLAMGLAYVGGMFLNDAFDREIDTRERPTRPIPAGEASALEVFGWGGTMIAGSVIAVGVAACWRGASCAAPVIAAMVLGALIVLYDGWHKGNPFAPVVMGLCRAGVYATAALVVSDIGSELILGAVLLWAYVVGLTYAAKQEHLGRVESAWPLALLFSPFVGYGSALLSFSLDAALYVALLAWVIVTVRPLLAARRTPGDVPRAVVRLIAGIALLDALAAARAGRPGLALLAFLAFPTTLALQRFVRGT